MEVGPCISQSRTTMDSIIWMLSKILISHASFCDLDLVEMLSFVSRLERRCAVDAGHAVISSYIEPWMAEVGRCIR
jgi:hypothetical protein